MGILKKRRPRGLMRSLSWCLLAYSGVFLPSTALAGPYAPAAGEPGTTAIYMDDPAFVAWATGWDKYVPGQEVDPVFMNPEPGLGKAVGTSLDVVSLGRGGEITLTFLFPIRNGEDWDFAVFENSFSDTYLELAYVEVSSNGQDFVRFDNDSLTTKPVSGFGSVDPTNVNGLAGKYRQGYGTPFDLQDLAEKSEVLSGIVNLARISHVRIIDIVGDGSALDSSGEVIYDPYPTSGSAGFDLEAVGVLHENTEPGRINNPPDRPIPISPLQNETDVELAPTLRAGPFSDPDPEDNHQLSIWQVSVAEGFSDKEVVFEKASKEHLTAIEVPTSILKGGTTYYWRTRFYDNEASSSPWSEMSVFTTEDLLDDQNANGIPDAQEIQLDWDGDGEIDADKPSVKAVNTGGEEVQLGVEKGSNVASIVRLESVDPSTTNPNGRPENLPSGLISFSLEVTDSDLPAHVTVLLSEPAPDGSEWYKYDANGGWRIYKNASFSPDGKSVILELQDGNDDGGDLDGVKNRIIVDPGGVGVLAAVSPPEDGKAGFGGGGCFITTVTESMKDTFVGGQVP